jgi:GNAT superfamily N-acetyltransferase
MESIHIRPLGPNDLADAARLLAQLNPDTPPPLVQQRLTSILADHPHYQLIGAFTGSQLSGVCSAWIATKIWCGRYLEIDNIVVDTEHRAKGIGSRLIKHLETLAREQDCKILALDSYTANHPSHRLYHRLGFEIWGYHFIKPIGDWSGAENE